MLERLPTHRADDIAALLPQRCRARSVNRPAAFLDRAARN
ncbi:hypothetical protein [Burkholderia ubonensis]